jgi:nicotinate phosphoribosyltransferase
MWLLKEKPGLLVDLYELTMAQAYLRNGMRERAYFEVAVRHLPDDWGYFVMAGLPEIDSFVKEFRFGEPDIEFLRSLGLFSEDFLAYLKSFRPDVEIRCLPEGTVFFPNEPILEVGGPVIDAQILESYVLNALGFSILAATLATRICHAAKGRAVVDFGLRRSQGPVATVRSARGAQIGNFSATSNLLASKLLSFSPAGTMAHSFIEVHKSEEEAFRHFAELYGERTILLVDTYEPREGVKKAAVVARQVYEEKGIKIRGVRIDSGDFLSLSKFAREHFEKSGVGFLKIFISSALDEYRIAELLERGAEIDGFGVGTRFAVSHSAPDIDIVYKIIEYGGRQLYKTSPDKQHEPGRKTVVRTKERLYVKDSVFELSEGADDLLKPFEMPEPVERIRERLSAELALLPESVKAIRGPAQYPVEFSF